MFGGDLALVYPSVVRSDRIEDQVPVREIRQLLLPGVHRDGVVFHPLHVSDGHEMILVQPFPGNLGQKNKAKRILVINRLNVRV